MNESRPYQGISAVSSSVVRDGTANRLRGGKNAVTSAELGTLIVKLSQWPSSQA